MRQPIKSQRHKSQLLAISLFAALALPLALALATCSTSSSSNEPTATDQIKIVAAFYPLQYAAEAVGSTYVSVTNLTSPGVEPHDLELSPAQITEIADADLVLYLKGFQPSVDEAVAQQAADHAIDVSAGIERLTMNPDADGLAGGLDPHVWLDPANITKIANSISDRLGRINTSAAPTFTANTKTLAAEMADLRGEFTSGLANCASRTLVASHDAFAYLAKAFGLTQVGISGLSPEAEPSPARLAEVADLVTTEGITTIYYETLVSPKVAETLASETGTTATVLDPLEGLAPGSIESYPDVMRSNLAALIAGQRCE